MLVGNGSEAAYRLDKPPATSEFKPSQMTTPRCSYHDAVWCLGYLLEGQSFAASNLLAVSNRLDDEMDTCLRDHPLLAHSGMGCGWTLGNQSTQHRDSMHPR